MQLPDPIFKLKIWTPAMIESEINTFICPACGETELILPEKMRPDETSYTELSELHGCDQSKTGHFIYGNGHSHGFGGNVQEFFEDGTTRVRWIPPRAVVAFHFYQNQAYLAREESASSCFPHPLFRNRLIIEGEENVFVAMTFLPHGETPTVEMRARGEAIAKAMR